jgi:imidazolonepropionase-like amidohydrolase
MHFFPRSVLEIALVLVGVSHGFAAQSTPPNDIALTGVTLIDGTGAAPRAGMTIVIARGRIARIQADSVSIPAGTRRQNLAGRFVIPGLIDAHVHLGTQPRPPGVMEQILRACFLGGVTSVRDMGGQFEVVSRQANLGNIDSIPMPRVVYSAIVAGPGMWLDGERAQFFAGASTPGNSPTVRRLTRHEDVAPAVASAKRAGASAIKIYNAVTPTLLTEVATEAHRQGLHVWSHLFVDPNTPSAVIDAGAEVVSHADMFVAELLPRAVREGSVADYRVARRAVFARGGSVATPAVIALLSKMKQRHVILDPTLFIMRPGPDSAGRVDPSRASLFHAAVEFTRAAHRAGVDVDAGTDALGGSTPNIHVELQLLVDSVGMTPLQAIHSATQVGARAMGLGDSVGTIEVGKRADLVVLSADPSRDIANTMSVVGVMKAGIYHERTRPLTPPPGARRPLPP